MNKLIIALGAFLAFTPVAYAKTNTGPFVEFGVTTINVQTEQARKKYKKYTGKTSMNGKSISLGYRWNNGWAIRGGYSKFEITTGYSVEKARKDLDLPIVLEGTVTFDWDRGSTTFIPANEVNIPDILTNIYPTLGTQPVTVSWNEGSIDLFDYSMDLTPVYEKIDIELTGVIEEYHVDVLKYFQIADSDLYIHVGVGATRAKGKVTGVVTYRAPMGINLSYTDKIEDITWAPRLIVGASYEVFDSVHLSAEAVLVTFEDYLLNGNVAYYWK